MSTKPMKSLNKQQPQTQIDIKDTEMVKCDDCGNASFIQAFFLRRLSALMSPTGQEALIPIQIYSCGNCGKVPDKLKQDAEG
jgi:DNA-directed RNA polymerase subunit RPC12/RpoP|tara:strand:- start:200 stop:445 length:246 start_codon:yes stop_codon:yes gene_type:complete